MVGPDELLLSGGSGRWVVGAAEVAEVLFDGVEHAVAHLVVDAGQVDVGL